MFKALDARNDTEIIILDLLLDKEKEELRELSRQDILICQGCRQSVRVRSGAVYRTHFAHKHKEHCEFVDESHELREARAVLYEWLVSKFGKENVTIEKKIDGLDLYRPVDCWVEKDEKKFAYWIFDSTPRPAKREIVKGLLLLPGVQVNWVFISEILRRDNESPETDINLTTTEREFFKHSKYDKVGAKGHGTKGTLHYLDAKKRELITYRNLVLFHIPLGFKGRSLVSDLVKVLISPKTGEFVHIGEHEQLERYLQGQDVLTDASTKKIMQARQTNWLLPRPPEPEPSIPDLPTSELSIDNVFDSIFDDEGVVEPPINPPQSVKPIPHHPGVPRWREYSEGKYPELVPKDLDG